MWLPSLKENAAEATASGYHGGTIIDPFCGSGTVNIEAGIMGYKTIGTDWNEAFVKSAQKNWDQMAEKFRYDASSGEFFPVDAIKFPIDKLKGTIVTEGYLGQNFQATPSQQQVDQNKKDILLLWKRFFAHLKGTEASNLVFCLPAWNMRGRKVSIFPEVSVFAKAAGFRTEKLFGGKETFFYEREATFVAREVCVFKKS